MSPWPRCYRVRPLLVLESGGSTWLRMDSRSRPAAIEPRQVSRTYDGDYAEKQLLRGKSGSSCGNSTSKQRMVRQVKRGCCSKGGRPARSVGPRSFVVHRDLDPGPAFSASALGSRPPSSTTALIRPSRTKIWKSASCSATHVYAVHPLRAIWHTLHCHRADPWRRRLPPGCWRAHHLTSTFYATSGIQHLNNGSQFPAVLE
jgi:hypothetical protein